MKILLGKNIFASMVYDFVKYAQKGNKFLNELASQLGDKSDVPRAARILRAVFHALRRHLTLEENFQLISQLPMALKGPYAEGWQPSSQRGKNSRKKIDFITEVIEEEGVESWRDFSDMEEGEHAIKAVFSVLKKYVSPGEMKDIESILPKELKSFISDSPVYKKGFIKMKYL